MHVTLLLNKKFSIEKVDNINAPKQKNRQKNTFTGPISNSRHKIKFLVMIYVTCKRQVYNQFGTGKPIFEFSDFDELCVKHY